ncbi:MAG: BrnA antitoxin family protein [Proteobacteria bacterium]|nr:BrnA antitoxin family protein [Pseudomonadota bacterium]
MPTLPRRRCATTSSPPCTSTRAAASATTTRRCSCCTSRTEARRSRRKAAAKTTRPRSAKIALRLDRDVLEWYRAQGGPDGLSPARDDADKVLGYVRGGLIQGCCAWQLPPVRLRAARLPAETRIARYPRTRPHSREHPMGTQRKRHQVWTTRASPPVKRTPLPASRSRPSQSAGSRLPLPQHH